MVCDRTAAAGTDHHGSVTKAFRKGHDPPGWDFAEHVGYSTPEHRAAIEKLGVSPLHRLSFQSMAYQQLAL